MEEKVWIRFPWNSGEGRLGSGWVFYHGEVSFVGRVIIVFVSLDPTYNAFEEEMVVEGH